MPDDEESRYPSDRRLALFNAMLTEHFVLQSVRGVTVSESTSRASVFLTTLSSCLVAYGFLAATQFATSFLLAVLPVLFLLGIFTYARMVDVALEDVAAVSAMQSIRDYYRAILPEGAKYFPGPADDSAPSQLLDIGRRSSWKGVFFTMATAIGIVNSAIAGAAAFVAASTLLGSGPSLIIGIISFVVSAVFHALHQVNQYRRYLGI